MKLWNYWYGERNRNRSDNDEEGSLQYTLWTIKFFGSFVSQQQLYQMLTKLDNVWQHASLDLSRHTHVHYMYICNCLVWLRVRHHKVKYTSNMAAGFRAQFIDVSGPHAKKPVFPLRQPLAMHRNCLRQSKRSWISSLIMYTSDATQ